MKKMLKHVIIGIYCFAFVFIFNACKKSANRSEPERTIPVFSIKSETSVENLSEINNKEAVQFLQNVQDLNIKSGTLSTLNETDSLIFYKFKYTNTAKTLIMYQFMNSDKYMVFNFEHKIDAADKNKEQVILRDYDNEPLVVENYFSKEFVGFTEPVVSITNQTIERKAAESWRQCVNRVYKKAVANCADDAFCDTACALANGGCNVLFLAGAVVSCTG